MKKYIVEKEDGKKVIVNACSSLDAAKKVMAKDKIKDSAETDKVVYAKLEKLADEAKKLNNSVKPLVEMSKKYWNNWNGYGKAVEEGELSKEKLKSLQNQLEKANGRALEIVKQYNKYASMLKRDGNKANMFNHRVLLPEDSASFPHLHYYYNDLDDLILERLDWFKQSVRTKKEDSIKDSDQTDIFNEIKSKYPGVKFSHVTYIDNVKLSRFRFIITGDLPSNLDRFDHTEYVSFERFVKYVCKKHGYTDVSISSERNHWSKDSQMEVNVEAFKFK